MFLLLSYLKTVELNVHQSKILFQPGQIVRNESVDDPTDAGASEEEEKRPPPPHLGDDERNRPAGDLHQGPEEVALVDVPFAQVGRILNVAVVAHEAHHAVKMFIFRKRENDKKFASHDVNRLKLTR